MPSLWILIPAFGRFDVSRVCFEQHRRVCDTLTGGGVDANCCVVADDENLDIARGFGFATVDRRNDFLGARYNDGVQFAAAEGVDWVTFSGSNTFLDAAALLQALPRHGLHLPYTQFCSFVHQTGTRRLDVRIPYRGIRLVVPIQLTRVAGYRPLPEDTLYPEAGILGFLRDREPRAQFDAVNQHQLEVVGFKTGRQLTSYEDIQVVHECTETDDPFNGLRGVYDDDLVDRIEGLYR